MVNEPRRTRGYDSKEILPLANNVKAASSSEILLLKLIILKNYVSAHIIMENIHNMSVTCIYFFKLI